MSEKASKDGQFSGSTAGDHSTHDYFHEKLFSHDQQRHGIASSTPPPPPPPPLPPHHEMSDLADSGEGEGVFSATDDSNRKMSEDSLISGSLRGSPLLRPTTHVRRFQDSDSCPSVSPSPDPDTQLRTFDFSNIEVSDEGESISAALQTEREFLDFMLSLPQVQKEAPAVTPRKDAVGQPSQDTEAPPLPEQRSPPGALPPNVGGVVGTKMGLDHLDNLCRMMEQLGELKEQNTRLQRRVHYLEELQTLQEMHRHLQETLEARRSGLGLGPIHLSDSDLCLDLDGDGEGVPGGELSHHGSEESLLLLGRHQHPHKGKTQQQRQQFFALERTRSKSVGPNLIDNGGHPAPKTKVSGWKRVKEALKWERATLLPPAPTPAKAISAHHPTSPQTIPNPQPNTTTTTTTNTTTDEDPFFRPPSSSSSSSSLTEVMTEEDLLNLYRQDFNHNQFLELPESPLRRHSSSEDDRRAATLERDDRGRPHDKEKKGHRSAWGKVKNMISTRRDSVRKKSSSSAHRKSTPERPGHEASGIGISVEVSAASDPEDYEVDYEGLSTDGLDAAGGLDTNDLEWETAGGVWAGPEHPHTNNNSLGVRRSKPQLTITVPSSEDLSLLQGAGDRPRPNQRSPESTRRKVSPAQMELRSSPSLPMTPPSPRRASNWTKVKKAFLTGQHNQHPHSQHPGRMDMLGSGSGGSSSLPPSPSKKNSFQFEEPHLLGVEESQLDDSYSPCPSVEVSPEDLIPPGTANTTPSPQPIPSSSPPQSHGGLIPQQGVQMNIADLQKSLSGEFNRRLQEWEKLKSGSGAGGSPSHAPLGTSLSGSTSVGVPSHPEDNLPMEFRKKLHEWEKMKEREREKVKGEMPRGQEDVKTKIHGEDDLPADFKKKLTEWKIRKALVGKSQQNVEELQKNLGEEFNRKMAEWERIKASANQSHSQVKPSASAGNIQIKPGSPPGTGSQGQGLNIKQSASAGQVLVKPVSPGPEPTSPRLDRKGSGHKIKKMKPNKTEKAPLTKAEGGHKARYKTDKELLWLEKELLKVERETQRLEREKEKFLERQARLEKMRQAMGQGPATKKEIYIKTSTGEFRFEGISQTFTKKLYEWEERRGIRPESSTIALLDPNYKAPEKEVQEKPKSPELVRLVRSKSESSIAADLVVTSGNSHPSSLSLNEIDQDEGGGLQADNKAASEPTLAGEDCTTPKVAVLVHLEEVEDGGTPSLHHSTTPYAPAEITRNIDSSGSEEDVTRRKRADDDEDMVTNLRHMDGTKSQGSYRSLLQENMNLLDKLRQKEDLCRSLEHQMGDIDSKMDNVADQHLRTLEKLHRQVTIIMKDTSSGPNDEEIGGDDGDTTVSNDDPEANQRLINQLRARIVELEVRGDNLKDEKEQLEMAFKLHKEQETEIAESLVMRIRELQDAGAEVNIQTVQCQTDDLPGSSDIATLVDTAPEETQEESHEELESKEEVVKEVSESESKKPETPPPPPPEEEKKEHHRHHREHRKGRKAPPKKVQKLHNLTGDLLFQAKCLEQALVSKHGLDRRVGSGGHGNAHRQRSLRGRSSLRLAGDSVSSHRRQREATARTWSSIEAITVPDETPPNYPENWESSSGNDLEAPAGSSGGLIVSSRSLRLPTSVNSSEPHDLLAMNAELSRMAKELRMELMKMWSFRESTSPESEASESIDRRNIEADTKQSETDRLVAEANEVFQSIALLQKERSPPASPQSARSPSTRSRRSPSTTSLSKRRGSGGFEDKGHRRSADRDRSRSSTGTPSRRDSYRQQRQKYEEEEDDDEDDEPPRNGKEPSMFLPVAATLDDLLLRTQLEEEDEGAWEGARRRSSDGLSTVTSGPSRSHSPSPSIASSAPETEVPPHLDDEDDSISLTGTWKSATTSTLRSGEHMLSSSFEWEDEDIQERRIMRGKWKAVVEEEEETDKLPEVSERSSKQELPEDARKSFETEVTMASPRIAVRELKTRRISDTQVEYDSPGQSNRDECFAYTFSKTVYDDEALTAGRLSRNPSVRQANSNSRDIEETLWRRLRSIPTTVSQDQIHSDRSPEIFVPTKRTIFTVQSGTQNPDELRATPTFVEIQEDTLPSSHIGSSDLFPGSSRNVSPTKQKKVNKTSTDDDTDTQKMSSESSSTNKQPMKDNENKVEGLVKEEDIQSECVPEHTDATPPTKQLLTDEDQLEPCTISTDKELSNDEQEESRELECEALDVPTPLKEEHSPRSSRQLTTVQLPTNTPMVAVLFQKTPPTSPPIDSKRKVLEAANEGVPTVRNIIQKFNRRITENQELLGSPFRSPPSSPPWQSPRSQRRLLSELAEASQLRGKSCGPESTTPMVNPASGVLKSLSTSVIMNNEIPQQVQRSASSSLVQNNRTANIDIPTSIAEVTASTKSLNSGTTSLSDVWKSSPTVTPTLTPATSRVASPALSPPISPTPTEADTSYDLDMSMDESAFAQLDRIGGSPPPGEKSPAGRLRAIKLKKAKEDFLSRGAAPVTGGQEAVKLRHRSGTASTDDSWRDSGEFAGSSPSPFPSITLADDTATDREATPDRPPRTASRRSKILKKESFRRQSAGCLLEESALDQSAQVVKSASSVVLGTAESVHRQSIDSESQGTRKASIDPSTDSGRSARGFFRLFRRHKNRDKKDMSSVQRLCRQSLLVDFTNARRRTQSASPQPKVDPQLFALPEIEGEDNTETTARSSKTLPRSGTAETVTPAPSRSCPSSPVAPHRSRTANWIARGRHIFKSRSPSPNKKQR